MAERIAKESQYQYTANSNLVIESRTRLNRDEPTGDPESLYGKIDPKEFGSKAQRSNVQPSDKQKVKKETSNREKRKRQTEDAALKRAYGFNSVVSATDDLESLNYRPKTKETQQIYEMMLGVVQKLLGDLTPETVRSATDLVLDILKSEDMKDIDKMNEIKTTLQGIDNDVFTQLLNLSKKLIDYRPEAEKEDVANEDAVDGEIGVAVVFDDEEEEGENLDEEEEEEEEEEVEYTNEAQIDQEDQGEVAVDLLEEDEVVDLEKDKKKEDETEVKAYEIDKHWVLRLVKTYYPDEQVASEIEKQVLQVLYKELTPRDYENELMEITDYSYFDLVKTLVKNRNVIVWTRRLIEAGQDTKERKDLEAEMIKKGLGFILTELESDRAAPSLAGTLYQQDQSSILEGEQEESSTQSFVPKQKIDLDMLAFSQGAHLMSNKKCKLPEGSFKRSHKGYDEYHVPAPIVKPMEENERLIPIDELPVWAHKSFSGSKSLNRVQSKVYPCAFGSDENMLLCAPTGAGKTNCAMLTILNEIGKHFNEDSILNLDAFKIVYIAPMKALVQEMVQGFGKRLAYLGIKVSELTGDAQLTKAQISETQIIVTTPEKWDIITRKATDRSYTNLVRLIIMDEIHLLHDDRGPVLESIIARTLRNIEDTQMPVRLVGLSATLPNFVDVATFLRVDQSTGLFFFDSSYRPCPLKQQFIGITDKKAIKRFQTMNEVTYQKILEQAGKNQTLIFVHSRKETARTAQALRDMALDARTLPEFITSEASKEVLSADAASTKDAILKDLLPCGFAIHHAGMNKADRTNVEDLFRDGHIQVLVSTATLAWGVNLPAHTVIIKGTQVYNPEKGRWSELSPQDVLQMLGRAGRPQYDTFGEGIIITTHSELQYYLSLLNQQLPIESQFISRLADNLNAEVVLGTIRNCEEAVQWLGYTYLYVRMLRNGPLYGISEAELQDDPYLRQKRVDLIHAAATLLDSCQLLKYDRRTGRFQGTELGRIASHYYISYRSMATYNQHLKPNMNTIELFRAFALSNEFKLIPVREEEKLEVAKLLERVPVPVKESADEPPAKISVLLQAYISQLNLEGFALMADMVYITQSANRILRAIFEMCLRRGWAHLARLALDLCKIVDRRCWLSMTPLRQFRSLPIDLIHKIERKSISFERYLDLSDKEIGELVGVPQAGKRIHRLVHMIPKLDLRCHVQPITRSMLLFELTVIPDFQWDAKIHGGAEAFWVLVEDSDGSSILYHEAFIVKQQYSQDEHYLSFTVPLHEPMPPNYFVSIISDRWLHSEVRQAVSFRHLILPERYPPPTELYDMQPLPVKGLKSTYQYLYEDSIEYFNPIQTQTFNTLYTTDDNVFIGAPSGSGKTICGEFAMLRLWSNEKTKDNVSRVVYLGPNQEVVDEMETNWAQRFDRLGKTVVKLTGETSADLKLLERGDLVLSTPTQWDLISRRWKQRRNVQQVGLLLMDDLHMVGGADGPTYEVAVSRMRYIASQTKFPTRFVALSAPLANAHDIAAWIGATGSNIFAFHPADRPVPLEIHIQSFAIQHFASRMLAMAKPTLLALLNNVETYREEDLGAIVYVPSRKQCRVTAAELVALLNAYGKGDDDDKSPFLGCSNEEIQSVIAQLDDAVLKQLLPSGIGFYHEALSPNDAKIMRKLYKAGAIRVLVASRDSCWNMGDLHCQLVVIMGAQYYEGKEHRYVDYPVTDLLKMLGRASKPYDGVPGRAILMCQPNKKAYYKKFLNEGLPIESHLDHRLHDHFNAEIVTRSIENKQDAVDFLTWTFLYRRLLKNPNYYELHGVTQQHISDHLTELVESTMDRLSETQCITVEDEIYVSPLNLGMIAAYYNIRYDTLDLMARSLTSKTTVKGLLEIISAANEFLDIPMRHHEEAFLKKLHEQSRIKLPQPNWRLPSTKVHLLLQAHFSRATLPPDMSSDQRLILKRIIPLLQATVDVTSSHGWLSPAIAAMELAQMTVQAIWYNDVSLRQLPYFDTARITSAEKSDISSVLDFIEANDTVRDKLLGGLTKAQVLKVARFCERYPSVGLEFELATPKDQIHARGPVKLQVHLEREMDSEMENEAIPPVIAPFYPGLKDESWWVVIALPSTSQLLGIKRFTLQQHLNLNLEFVAPSKMGLHNLTIYLMSDSYSGVDQEFELELEVGEPLDSEESEEESSEESDMED